MELEAECEDLQQALKSKGESLINLVLSKNKRDRYKLREAFKEYTGKDLEEVINKCLSGNFRRVFIDLFRNPTERDAIYLYKAMKGAGTDEDTVIEIICSRSNVELEKIRKEYEERYKENLEKRVTSETSGNFRNLLVSLLQCRRSENSMPDDAECRRLAEQLYKAGEGKMGTDDATFNKVFALSSPPEIFSINQYYSQLSSRSLSQAVDKEFSGDLKTALNTILEAIISPTNYFARRINKAVKGLGTNDKLLIRTICSREGIDMKEIRESYKNLFGKDMIEDIKDDTSGLYQKVLVTLASGD